ncbi:MAG: PAS domain-containing protein [Campylobacterales bacterium]|nr:PAS domain-containing protein [Campylobacterales bacterium]
MQKPTPKNEEIILDPKRYIVSKTDEKGVITYGNDYFVEISGYKESELIGQPHNMIRHPDMPRVVFKLMWDRIQNGQPIMALVKNMAKDGRYYWVVTEFESKRDKLTNKIISYTAFRKAAPRDAIKAIEPVYAKLREIEAQSGMEGAQNYLLGFLEDKGLSYDEYINQLVGNKGLFKIFFAAMKKLFG